MVSSYLYWRGPSGSLAPSSPLGKGHPVGIRRPPSLVITKGMPGLSIEQCEEHKTIKRMYDLRRSDCTTIRRCFEYVFCYGISTPFLKAPRHHVPSRWCDVFVVKRPKFAQVRGTFWIQTHLNNVYTCNKCKN